GTGAAPVIAQLAKDKGILTVAVITEPFNFEGRRRRENATKGIDDIRKFVDTLIIIPNEKIKEVVPKNATFQDSLRVADDVLRQGIRGIADLIVTPALINLDFADVRTILKDRGLAHMGVGVAKGENRIVEAVRLAVNCPLLETTIEGASGVIINIVGGNDLTLNEVDTAVGLVHSVVDFSANIIFGACIDENMCDEVQVTVIATGFPSVEEARAEAAARPTTDVFRYAPAPAPMPAPAYSEPQQPEVYAAAYGTQPVAQQPQQQPQPVAAPQPQPVAPQPVAEEHAPAYEPEEDDYEETVHDKKLPPFVQRLLGKKK
ncbi:MAG: cell division protein FtsZ, partial [Clostridiales bacterium]|nr:cell division protein FtsZ [Clostridiales bacterium]